MTPQERELLTGLFERLGQCEGQAKEPEAAAFIADAVARHPGAPYFMAQLLLVQDHALSAAQARIRALEQAAGAGAASGQGTSFLPLGFGQAPTPAGPWGRPAASVPSAGASYAPARRQDAFPSMPPPTPSPQPPQPAAGSGAGGFLRGALQTATGVAGGALLFEGISSLFHRGGAPWGLGGFAPAGAGPTFIEETVVNDYGLPAQAAEPQDAALMPAPQDAALMPAPQNAALQDDPYAAAQPADFTPDAGDAPDNPPDDSAFDDDPGVQDI